MTRLLWNRGCSFSLISIFALIQFFIINSFTLTIRSRSYSYHSLDKRHDNTKTEYPGRNSKRGGDCLSSSTPCRRDITNHDAFQSSNLQTGDNGLQAEPSTSSGSIDASASSSATATSELVAEMKRKFPGLITSSLLTAPSSMRESSLTSNLENSSPSKNPQQVSSTNSGVVTIKSSPQSTESQNINENYPGAGINMSNLIPNSSSISNTSLSNTPLSSMIKYISLNSSIHESQNKTNFQNKERQQNQMSSDPKLEESVIQSTSDLRGTGSPSDYANNISNSINSKSTINLSNQNSSLSSSNKPKAQINSSIGSARINEIFLNRSKFYINISFFISFYLFISFF
ncbi:hypothetical protein BY996DRAFT_6822414 [Phakopsora pachyrhizi]|nr:hypothetical protein BY996DRAFT_6822414 [Phakopsora pachyrhizi]